jgi:alkyldihydroxyacetonephosphate synthase
MDHANEHIVPQRRRSSTSFVGLRALLPAGRVSDSPSDLRRHSRDAWSIAIKAAQQEKHTYYTELVVSPRGTEEVARVLDWAGRNGVAVTPWGAGSSVTGAPLPLTGGITMDLSNMDQVVSVDLTNQMITVQAGAVGVQVEQYLNQRGYTLGHSPQSLGVSTAGGWVATRATGQFSSRYGGIEHLVIALTVVLPSGEVVVTPRAVRAPVGPDLKHLFIGAEGTLGVVTEVTLRIFPCAQTRLLEAVAFDTVESGLRVMRRVMQCGLSPFIVRFYDREESRHVMHDRGFPGCVMFLGFEGLSRVAQAEHAEAMAVCVADGGRRLGADPVAAWMARRFDFSTIENLLAHPAGVAETIEVANFWDRIQLTWSEMKSALSRHASEVLGHFSHVYPQGTSLYVILLGSRSAPRDAASAEAELRTIWNTANEVALRTGASTAHHHGVGLARLSVIRRDLGSGMILLERVKEALDPAGIMCPGKLSLDGH